MTTKTLKLSEIKFESSVELYDMERLGIVYANFWNPSKTGIYAINKHLQTIGYFLKRLVCKNTIPNISVDENNCLVDGYHRIAAITLFNYWQGMYKRTELITELNVNVVY